MYEFVNFPLSKNLTKFTMLQVYEFTTSEKQNPFEIINNKFSRGTIGGGIMGGCTQDIIQWHGLIYDTYSQFFEKGVFAGKDQTIYNYVVLQNLSECNIVHVPPNYTHDRWFYLEDYLN